MKEGKGWKLEPKEKGGKEGGRKGKMEGRRDRRKEGGKRRKRKGDQDKSDEENKRESSKGWGRVEWRRGTKETKNKRKCLNLIPSALEYTCFPEAVLLVLSWAPQKTPAKLKVPAQTAQTGEERS